MLSDVLDRPASTDPVRLRFHLLTIAHVKKNTTAKLNASSDLDFDAGETATLFREEDNSVGSPVPTQSTASGPSRGSRREGSKTAGGWLSSHGVNVNDERGQYEALNPGDE